MKSDHIIQLCLYRPKTLTWSHGSKLELTIVVGLSEWMKKRKYYSRTMQKTKPIWCPAASKVVRARNTFYSVYSGHREAQ